MLNESLVRYFVRVFIAFFAVMALSQPPLLLAQSAPTSLELVNQFAEDYLGHLNQMLSGDPSLMQEGGLQPGADLTAAWLDTKQTFQLHLVDMEALYEVQRLEDAVKPTGVYYTPWCLGNTCPFMASYRLDEQTNAVTLVSVGDAQYRTALESGRRKIEQQDLDINDAKVVSIPVSDFELYMVPSLSGGRLIPLTERDERDLYKMLLDEGTIAENEQRRVKELDLGLVRDFISYQIRMTEDPETLSPEEFAQLPDQMGQNIEVARGGGELEVNPVVTENPESPSVGEEESSLLVAGEEAEDRNEESTRSSLAIFSALLAALAFVCILVYLIRRKVR